MRERVHPHDSLSDRTAVRSPINGAGGCRAKHSQEGCESGRIGTLGKRVWGNPPWVRIPLPPPSGPPRSAGAPRMGVLTPWRVSGWHVARSVRSSWPRSRLAAARAPPRCPVLRARPPRREPPGHRPARRTANLHLRRAVSLPRPSPPRRACGSARPRSPREPGSPPACPAVRPVTSSSSPSRTQMKVTATQRSQHRTRRSRHQGIGFRPSWSHRLPLVPGRRWPGVWTGRRAPSCSPHRPCLSTSSRAVSFACPPPPAWRREGP